jgi:hypothetical protein
MWRLGGSEFESRSHNNLRYLPYTKGIKKFEYTSIRKMVCRRDATSQYKWEVS